MKIKPLFDRVLLRPIQEPHQTSGLAIPISAEDRPFWGKVVAVGQPVDIEGKDTKFLVSVGDVVIYSKYGGLNITIDKTEHVIIKQQDILAKVGDTEDENNN